MYPWFWSWAPRIQFPFSGALSQWVEPNTDWFFGSIPPQAGIGELEKKIFDVASYGRQLGLITEVLLDSVREESLQSEKGGESLARLRRIQADIENVKSEHELQLTDSAIAILEKLRAKNPDELARVVAKFAVK